ncbi:hypothetical protein CC1G_08780 [Coprinopsis cinerea okayama7|uniref:F-box domain-containing protein n=1 Tax=Coprinopsis cinerea (strain Okayama-7 / 130 / ATCC MYA-4618 / FGSC 9003) TaxID=240176 RepID=A8N430_COPC7|nr:hypothetical protein CC1G_08780 [Coprinopsis cinerea okayama7\|eukprot:XP_001829625.2 hypothetical protein CC1G_08780 [Coprinopsis cinerea okayama7\
MKSLPVKPDLTEALAVLACEVLPQLASCGYRGVFSGLRIKASPSRRQRPQFTSLPNETLTEILKHLEWRDVLALRQCCRSLYSLSKERHVWYNLFLKYHKTTFAQPYFLPKPLEHCSSDDLENHVTSWWSVLGNTTGESITVATYAFDRTFDPRLIDHLLPLHNGHYLYGAPDGTILYGDPCRPEMGMRVLAPSPFSGEANVDTYVALDFHLSRDPDVRRNSFPTSFRLAVTRQPRNDPGVVEIWEITSQLEQGVLTGYSTALLQSITEHPHVNIRHCSIFAEHVAYVIDGRDNFIAIVDWTKVEDDKPLSRTFIPRGTAIEKLFLLPSKRIFVMYNMSVSIRDWGRTCSSTTLHEDPAFRLWVDPQWEHPQCSRCLHPFITPYIVRDYTRFVLACRDHIVGISIPNDPEADIKTSVTTTRLAEAPLRSAIAEDYSFGYSKGAYYNHYSGAYHHLTYNWPDDEPLVCSVGTVRRSAIFNPRCIHYDGARGLIYTFRRYDGLACSVIGSMSTGSQV